MSILIKGMEMPTKCIICPLEMYGYCLANNKKNVGESVVDFVKDEYCPLVPVPKHGRLIDADALRCLYDPHDYGLDGEQADEYDRYHVSLPVIRQNIDDMPTIIPAEEGET